MKTSRASRPEIANALAKERRGKSRTQQRPSSRYRHYPQTCKKRHEGQPWTAGTSLEERREGEPQSASSGRSNDGITTGKETSR